MPNPVISKVPAPEKESPIPSGVMRGQPYFLQQNPVQATIQQAGPFEKKPTADAHVLPYFNPTKVWVDDPNTFDETVLAHELTHVYGNTHELPRASSGRMGTSKGGDAALYYRPRDPYFYGGVTGLEAAQRDKMTIQDFGTEQRSAMVEEYMALSKQYELMARWGALTPDVSRNYERVAKAYGPYIQQMSGIPLGGQKLSLWNTKDPGPPPAAKPPGLPDPSTTGFFSPLPGIPGDYIKTR